MFHFHLQHLRSVCIRGKALGKARTADPQYFAARRQQRHQRRTAASRQPPDRARAFAGVQLGKRQQQHQ